MEKQKFIEKVLNSLPQGSGFDCFWGCEVLKNGAVIFSTSYHNMDEMGGYDGFTSIRVKYTATEVFNNDYLDFQLMLNGKNRYRDHSTREYYADTIHYSLVEGFK